MSGAVRFRVMNRSNHRLTGRGCKLAVAGSLGAIASVMLIGSALAQDGDTPARPGPEDPKRTIPEKIEPPERGIHGRKPDVRSEGAGQDEPLSERLGRTGGVIRPPENIDPEAEIRPPAPDSGTIRVIPPPGSPANPSPVRPK